MGNLFQIRQMAVQEGGPNGQEVGVAGVVDLDNTPRVLAGADLAAPDLDDVLGADDGEGHEAPEFSVLLDGVLVVLLDVVGKVVDRDPVVLNILHNKLLGLSKLSRGEGIRSADDGDDVDAGSKALHELDIKLAKAGKSVNMRRYGLGKGGEGSKRKHIPVTRGGDEVKHGMNSVVSEARVTLDPRLLGQNIVILSLEIADNL